MNTFIPGGAAILCTGSTTVCLCSSSYHILVFTVFFMRIRDSLLGSKVRESNPGRRIYLFFSRMTGVAQYPSSLVFNDCRCPFAGIELPGREAKPITFRYSYTCTSICSFHNLVKDKFAFFCTLRVLFEHHELGLMAWKRNLICYGKGYSNAVV